MGGGSLEASGNKSLIWGKVFCLGRWCECFELENAVVCHFVAVYNRHAGLIDAWLVDGKH